MVEEMHVGRVKIESVKTVCLVIALFLISTRLSQAEQNRNILIRQRMPVAGCFTQNGQRLLIANRKSGTITVIDTENGQTLDESNIARQIGDFVRVPGNQQFALLTDLATHKVLLLDTNRSPIRILQRLPVAKYPRTLAVSADGQFCSVASLWPRKLTILRLNSSRLQKVRLIDLPFPPCQQRFLNRQLLLVADAFAGDTAVVNVQTGEISKTADQKASNIRDIFFDGTALYLVHQILNPRAQTTKKQIGSGNLIQNVIRKLPVQMKNNSARIAWGAAQNRLLGHRNRGAADPTAIIIHPTTKQFFVVLAGTQEIAVFDHIHGAELTRIPVGDQPGQMLLHNDQRRLYVLNRLSDSVSVIDTCSRKVVQQISLGPDRPRSPAEEGERLFHDARLSYNGWLSCDTCHPGGYTTGGLADTLGDDTYGTPKRILSLLGTADNNPWAWSGSQRVLHDQIHKSVRSSMQGDALTPDQARQMVAYLHTLPPPPPKLQQPQTQAEQQRYERGKDLFTQLRCVRCHIPPLTFTMDQVFDVGLTDEQGLKMFNPPSLRGVGHRRSYFHDGRAKILREVFTEHAHQLDRELSDVELKALLRYLNGL